MSEPQAVSRAYAGSYCDATVAEMDGETRYQTMHAHRCTGEHGTLLGVKTHSCACRASFYFLEDMLNLVVQHIQDREATREVTGIDTTERQFIDNDGNYFTEPNPQSAAGEGWPYG